MRKTLILSAFMFLFSLTMFVGATYAWFSTEVTVNDNTIIIGILDMKVSYTDESNTDPDSNEWIELIGTNKLFDLNTDNSSIEPGSTVEKWIKVENTGNIPLKFRFITTNVDIDDELMDMITFNTTINGQAFQGSMGDFETDFIELYPDEYVIIPVTMHVDECIGNDGMLKTLIFDLIVEAKQLEWDESIDTCDLDDDENCDDDCDGDDQDNGECD